MLITSLIAESRLAPGGNRSRTADRGFTFTTTVGMVAGVHNRTANGRSPTHVTLTSGLTDIDVAVFRIAYLTNGCHAIYGNVAKLTGGETEKCISVFLSHKLCHTACRTCKLCATAGIKLDVVEECTYGDVYHRKCITCYDIGIRTADDGIANLKTCRSDDIALFAVLILNEGDESGTVRVILESLNDCRNSETLTLKVDYSVLSAVTAAAMANGDAAIAVTACIFL